MAVIKKNKKGFTLVEVVVVIAIMALILPAVYALVFSVLKQQVRLYRLTEVKRQGDALVTLTTDLIRNKAYQIYASSNPNDPPVCVSNDYTPDPDDGTQMFFKMVSGKYFQIYLNPSGGSDAGPVVITSTDTTLPSGNITDSKVIITDFHMKCTRSSTYAPPIIKYHFTIQFKTSDPHDALPLTYYHEVVLRNY